MQIHFVSICPTICIKLSVSIYHFLCTYSNGDYITDSSGPLISWVEQCSKNADILALGCFLCIALLLYPAHKILLVGNS